MSQTFEKAFVFFNLIVTVLFAWASTASATTTEACANATPLAIDSIYRGYGDGGTDVFALDVPAAGIVALDVTVSGTAQAEPKLGFLGRGCSRAADGDAATITRSVARQTIAFRTAGEYYIRIAAQDPQQALGDYKLHTRFVAAGIVDDTFETDLGRNRGRALVRQTDFFVETTAKADDGEPLLSLLTVYDPGAQPLEDEEVDPDPNGLEDEEVDPDPNGLAASGSASTRGPQGLEDEEVDPDPNGFIDGERVLDSMVVVHGRGTPDVDFCDGRGADDHQDLFACASSVALGAPVSGRLGNDWHDDVDVFSIELEAAATLLVATRGIRDAVAGLYDSFGQRLAVDGGGAGKADPRIVKSLEPGRYFIRVESGGSPEASYELTIQALEW